MYTLLTAEQNILNFMADYRTNFPTANILPKMHILEDHVVPWVRKWRIGSGVMGEQGAESIHAHIARLEAQYGNIVNPLEELRYVFNEHNLESVPALSEPAKKYKSHTSSTTV